MTAPVIIWFRQDLRLADQAAVRAAAESGAAVIPVYILDDKLPKHRRMGAASRWWLHHSLKSLDESLRERGARLILLKGKSDEVLADLAKSTKASAVRCIRHYEPWWRNAEKAVAKALPGDCDLVRHDGNYLMPPGSVTTGDGAPYKIFTPFWRALYQHMPPHGPMAAPEAFFVPSKWPASDVLEDWGLLPERPNWASGFAKMWVPGEAGAAERLEDFADIAAQYDNDRNLPSIDGSSFLSPHLHFGEISPAAVWHAVKGQGGTSEVFLKEVAWRDYAQNVILQFPEYGMQNARERFDVLRWRRGKAADADLLAWQKGRTGYPIVDAGMRQLWATGWMHNRVRMIAASFLVKHLLIDWRVGEEWFWDTLIDADYANNSVNWQWIAGTGIDSNMFVRIMAPLSQSEKFDAADYIRQWVPELAHLDDKAIHDPDEHESRPDDYPAKIIGHREARERALAAYARSSA